MNTNRPFVLVLVLMGLVCLVPTVAAQQVYSPPLDSPDEQRADPKPASLLSHEPIEIHIAVDRTPDDPNSVSMTITPKISDEISFMRLRLPDEATVVDTGKYKKNDNYGHFYWNEGTVGDRSIEIKLPDTATGDNFYSREDLGEKIFVADTESWTIVDNPFKYGYFAYASPGTGDILFGPKSGGMGKVEYTMEIEEYSNTDAGVAKQDFAFFGEFSKYSHEANDRNYELVVAEDASLGGSGPDAAPDSPEEIFEVLSDTTDDVNIGEENEEVTVYVMPSVGDTNTVNVEFTGVASETETMLTEGAKKSVYVHEYIHLRQKHYTNRLAWLTEASAEYYQHKLPLHQGWYTYDQYEENIDYGLNYNGEKLVDQDGSEANYYKGALALEKIDRDIRGSTNGNKNLQTVLRELHDTPGSVNLRDFYKAIEQEADEGTAEKAESYIQGTNNLESSPSRSKYNSAFDTDFEPSEEATVGSSESLPGGGNQLRVNSEVYINDRDDPIDPQTDTNVSPGDRVRIVTEYENTGQSTVTEGLGIYIAGSFGTYDQEIGPNEENSITWGAAEKSYSYEFQDSGQKELAVKVGADVRESYSFTVRDANRGGSSKIEPSISAAPSRPEVGEEVTLSGTDSTIRNGEIAEYKWEFESGKSATGSTVQQTFTDPGYYTVALVIVSEKGDSQVTTKQIEVVEDAAGPTDEESVSVETPGFGFGTTLSGIVGAGYMLRRRLKFDPCG